MLRDWFIIWVKIFIISLEIYFNWMLEIPSCPELDLDLSLWMVFKVNSVDTVSKENEDNMFCLR